MSQSRCKNPFKEGPRVLFFGMQGTFSPPSLAALLKNGMDVCAIVLPAIPLPGMRPPVIRRRTQEQARRTILPLIREGVPTDLVQIATSRQIPIWEVSRLAHAETVETLAAYHPDFICVACFSRHIPHVILQLPEYGCLNVHPSLLPANRGPLPLFWDLREGRVTTGVTIHEIEEKMDRGAILAQETFSIPDGISYEQLEARCAELGGKLLAQTVQAVCEGRARRVPQDETKSSYRSFPTAEDFLVDPSSWSARHLYNFIRGVRNWESPIVLQMADEQLLAHDAVDFGEGEPPSRFADDSGLQWNDGHLVKCWGGWVRVLSDYQGKPAS